MKYTSMTEYREEIVLTGGDEPDVSFWQEQADGGRDLVMRSPGVLKGFEGMGKGAAVVWRDDDAYGEIIVDRAWKRHAGEVDREDATRKADALARRAINWTFVEFAR